MAYHIGYEIKLRCSFTTASDIAVDPTSVTVKIKDPANEITTYVYGEDEEVVRESAGVYHIIVTVDQKGKWFHRWAGSGSAVVASEEVFYVADSVFD